MSFSATYIFNKFNLNLSVSRRNSLLSILDQGLISGSNFLISFILGRNLPLDEFGLYLLMFSTWVFINNLQIGFINQGLYVLINSGEKNYKECISIIQYIFSIVILIVLLAASFIMPYFVNIEVRTMIIFSLAVFCCNLREFDRNYSMAEMKMNKIVLYDFLLLLFYMAALYILIFTNSLSIDTAWIVIAAGSLIFVIADFFFDAKKYNLDKAEILRIFRTNNKFSSWVLLGNITTWFNGNFYKFLAAGSLSLNVVAIMGGAQQIVFLVNPIAIGFQNFNISYLSRVKKENPEGFQSAYRKYAFTFLMMAGSILLPLALFPDYFLELFYKDKFAGSGLILRLFCLVMILSIAIRVLQAPTTIAKKTHNLFYIQAVCTVISLLTLLFYLKDIGVYGFLSYLVLSNVLILAGNYYYARRIRTNDTSSR